MQNFNSEKLVKEFNQAFDFFKNWIEVETDEELKKGEYEIEALIDEEKKQVLSIWVGDIENNYFDRYLVYKGIENYDNDENEEGDDLESWVIEKLFATYEVIHCEPIL